MLKPLKVKKVEKLNQKFSSAKTGILAEYKGLSVQQLTDLRKNLKGIKSEFQVIKNTLARRATKDTSFEKLNKYFNGPTSIALGCNEQEIIKLTKELVSFAQRENKLKIIAGIVEGEIISLEEIKELAETPPREELLRILVFGIKFPLNKLANSLNGILLNLIYALTAIKEKKNSE